jgi:hypothetical protein
VGGGVSGPLLPMGLRLMVSGTGVCVTTSPMGRALNRVPVARSIVLTPGPGLITAVLATPSKWCVCRLKFLTNRVC